MDPKKLEIICATDSPGILLNDEQLRYIADTARIDETLRIVLLERKEGYLETAQKIFDHYRRDIQPVLEPLRRYSNTVQDLLLSISAHALSLNIENTIDLFTRSREAYAKEVTLKGT